MPTPLTTSGRGFSNPEVEAGNPKRRLVNEVEVLRRSDTDWGKFEPAIRAWEVILGRPAPNPTYQTQEDKRHELNPVFVEWMMSLPDGWVTGHGLKPVEELKMLGNGVVPLQAELALRSLLGLDELPERERERVNANAHSISYVNAQRTARNVSGASSAIFDRPDWDEPGSSNTNERIVMLPTPTVSDTFTSNLKSSQQKDGSMHSVTLPQAVERLANGER